MYRLNQWAWDFPTLWEPHGSFTPLFTSQPEELAFPNLCHCVCIYQHPFPLSCFSPLFFCFFCLFYELQRRQCSFCRLSWWIRLPPSHNEWPRLDTEWLLAQWECHWWKESFWERLSVPAVSLRSQWHPVSPLRSITFDWQSHFFPFNVFKQTF